MLIRPEVRNDKQGGGNYGDKRGSGTHKGIDFCCDKGVDVRSHVDGVVSKIGKPYYFDNPDKKQAKQNALRYVEVSDADNVKHRFFYILPSVALGDPIEMGGIIGKQQDLQDIYGKKMKNHCHYEVKINGNHVNPSPYL